MKKNDMGEEHPVGRFIEQSRHYLSVPSEELRRIETLLGWSLAGESVEATEADQRSCA